MPRSRSRASWHAPDCPNGHLHIYVDRGPHEDREWTCWRCMTHFDADVPAERRE